MVLSHFPCKGHAGLGRPLSAVDLWQEPVDLMGIGNHDFIVAEEHAASCAKAGEGPSVIIV